MAAGAEFWVTYQVTDSNGAIYTPYSEDFSSSLSDTPEIAEFSETSVTFYNYRNESVGSLSFEDPYNYNGVDYSIIAIHCNGADAQNNTFNNISGGCQIFVYYGKDPETGGPDQGENPPTEEDPKDAIQSDTEPLSFKFTIKYYKANTATSILDDFIVDTCYYLKRDDEGIVGENGLLNLIYYTGYEFTGNTYKYTEEKTYIVPSIIPGYKLSGFHGLENGEYKTGEKDGINNYPFEAYYIDNSFKVTIDAKGIDRSYVTVQNPNTTSIKYELPYEDNYPNTSLLLEAITNNEEYEFDYWDVNGEKKYNDILSYEIKTDLQIYCYFKEKDIPGEYQIATNDDIYEKSSFTYKIEDKNPSQCPVYDEIINDGNKLINIYGDYLSNQCVRYNDINMGDIKITGEVINNTGGPVKKFYIYFGVGDDKDKNLYSEILIQDTNNTGTDLIEPMEIVKFSADVNIDQSNIQTKNQNDSLWIGFNGNKTDWGSERALKFVINDEEFWVPDTENTNKEYYRQIGIKHRDFLKENNKHTNIKIYIHSTHNSNNN